MILNHEEIVSYAEYESHHTFAGYSVVEALKRLRLFLDEALRSSICPKSRSLKSPAEQKRQAAINAVDNFPNGRILSSRSPAGCFGLSSDVGQTGLWLVVHIFGRSVISQPSLRAKKSRENDFWENLRRF